MSCRLDRKTRGDRLSHGFLLLLPEKGKGRQKLPHLAVLHSEMTSVRARAPGPWGHVSSGVSFLPEDLAATVAWQHMTLLRVLCPSPAQMPVPAVAASGSN